MVKMTIGNVMKRYWSERSEINWVEGTSEGMARVNVRGLSEACGAGLVPCLSGNSSVACLFLAGDVVTLWLVSAISPCLVLVHLKRLTL